VVHGVGLEDEDSPPHKQNKRGKRRREDYNVEGQMARTKTLERQPNPRSGDTF